MKNAINSPVNITKTNQNRCNNVNRVINVATVAAFCGFSRMAINTVYFNCTMFSLNINYHTNITDTKIHSMLPKLGLSNHLQSCLRLLA